MASLAIIGQNNFMSLQKKIIKKNPGRHHFLNRKKVDGVKYSLECLVQY